MIVDAIGAFTNEDDSRLERSVATARWTDVIVIVIGASGPLA